MKILLINSLLLILSWHLAKAATVVNGLIIDENEEPVVGANVHWSGTQIGVSTDVDGLFQLPLPEGAETVLVSSYVGYLNDTVRVQNTFFPVRVQLKNQLYLNEVVVSQRKMSTISSRFTPLQTQQITTEELARAACCNLAESFETNPSVDVSYSDAATGARQIRLLGLAGTYVQMLTENFPNFRGVASAYGLDYVPGPWLESIYVSKGTSSVKNGYEALAGQINVEFKKPRPTTDILSANVFLGDNGRYEANLDGTRRVATQLYSTLLAHYSSEEHSFDKNKDGFMDSPLKRQLNLMNRWELAKDAYIAQFGVRFIAENRKGGQVHSAIHHPDSLYRITLDTYRLEAFSKNGYVLNQRNNESVALILSGSYHDQKSDYGFRPYNAYQTNLYASLLYERDFTKAHKISTGLSLNYDAFDENYLVEVLPLPTALKNYATDKETVSGAFAEYTFTYKDKLVFLAGLRADHSNQYNWFVTPRVHLKYNFTDWLHLRASAGKGWRNTRVLAENNQFLASSRKLLLANDLRMEEAWNYGTNLSFYIPILNKDLVINAEYYYTHFENQVVMDLDTDAHAVSFYNLEGKSYSTNFQIEATYPITKRLSATAAYRRTKVKTTYQGVLLDKPFNNKYKAMFTTSYQTAMRKWQFDFTSQFNGGGRLPTPDVNNPLWKSTFKSFVLLNTQATKYFKDWSVYLGVENLLDFVQKNPIVSADSPYGGDFDSSIVWGPLHGRKIYLGARFAIPSLMK